MRSISLLLLLFSFCDIASASNGVPLGKNCNLSVPPSDAGEVSTHGVLLRVYPRAKDITESYSGCQALLAPDGDKWTVISLTEVIDGDPVRVWWIDEQDSVLANCQFRNGRVVHGEPKDCPAPKSLLIRSVQSGCTGRREATLSKQGLGVPAPPECGLN